MGRIFTVLMAVVVALALAAAAGFKAGAEQGLAHADRNYQPVIEDLRVQASARFRRERDNHVNDVLTLAWENGLLRAALPDNGRQVVKERRIYLPGVHWWPDAAPGVTDEKGFVEDSDRPCPPFAPGRCLFASPLAGPCQVPQ